MFWVQVGSDPKLRPTQGSPRKHSKRMKLMPSLRTHLGKEQGMNIHGQENLAKREKNFPKAIPAPNACSHRGLSKLLYKAATLTKEEYSELLTQVWKNHEKASQNSTIVSFCFAHAVRIFSTKSTTKMYVYL